MIHKHNKLLLKISHGFEAAISVVLVVLILLGTVDLIRGIYNAYIVDFANPVEYTQLNSFLAEALLLVIGIELVVMLSLHIPGVLLEVLLYAIARKLILLPKTSGMIDLLLGIVAIALLFAIKKYLLTDGEKSVSLSILYSDKKKKLKEIN